MLIQINILGKAYSEDLTNEYIFFSLWGYGNDTANYGVDRSYSPFSAEREEDVASIGEWWGEPYDDDGVSPLSLSILDTKYDQSQLWQTQLRFGAGSSDNYHRSILTGGLLGESDFSFMVSFDEQGNGGYAENIFLKTKSIAISQAQFGRVRLGYDGEIFNASLQITQAETERGDDSLFLSALPNRFSISEVAGWKDNKEESSILIMQWQLDESWTFISSSSYLRTEKELLQDIDRTPDPLEFFFFVSTADLYSQQFDLEYLNDESEQFLVSLNYLYEESENNSVTTGFLLAPVFNGQVWLALLEREEIFKLDFQIAKEWNLPEDGYLALQVQYQEHELDRIEVDLASVTGLVDEDDVLRIEFANPEFSQWTSSLLFDYPLSDEGSLSIDFDQNFRPGGVSLNLVSGIRRPYRQQLESRIDFGLYTTDPEADYNFVFNLFYSNIKNIQVAVFGNRQNPFDVGIVNAGRGTASGIEIEFEYLPSETFKLNVESVFQETRYHSFPEAFRGLNGNQFIFKPKTSVTATLLWQLSDEWIFSFQQIYRGSNFSEAENIHEDIIESTYISNIKLGYEKENWAVYLWGANVTDELDFLYKSSDNDLAIAGIEATWGMSFEKRF